MGLPENVTRVGEMSNAHKDLAGKRRVEITFSSMFSVEGIEIDIRWAK